MTEVRAAKVAEALRAAIEGAIRDVGIAQFRATSLFASNERRSEQKRAA